jgi:hypothetical protein
MTDDWLEEFEKAQSHMDQSVYAIDQSIDSSKISQSLGQTGRSLYKLEQALNNALSGLDAPSIQADVATISATTTRSTRPSQTYSRSTNEWFYNRWLEVATSLGVYIVNSAERAGQIKNASNTQISWIVGLVVMILVLIFTGYGVGTILGAGASAGKMTELTMGSVRPEEG